MRAAPMIVLACLATVAGGCGGDDQQQARRPDPPVKLSVTTPADDSTVREESVQVEGTVEPAGSTVLVLGQKAPVSGGGTFTARVPLEPGANVIDVMATAGGRSPALTAFRVSREVPVTMPDLSGKSVDEVQTMLEDLGLTAEVKEGGGLLEDLLPGDPAVCQQDPEPGAQVHRGSRVHVVVSKSC